FTFETVRGQVPVQVHCVSVFRCHTQQVFFALTGYPDGGMWFLDGVWVADRVLHSVVFSVERCTFLRPHQFHDLNCFVQPSYPDRCFLGEWSPVSLVLRQISEFLMNS